MKKVVGIDRRIKRVWLDALLDRLVQTTNGPELRAFLDKHLKDDLPGHESRAKTTGILLRIWSGLPQERLALRDRAVAMLPRITGRDRIWLHWGMTALAYPFFRDTAEIVGRLLALQDDFTTAQIQARLLTSWGDRPTTKQAAQKLVTTLVDWEVLRATKAKGHFLLASKLTADSTELQLWLLEAMLGASAADEIEAQQLQRLPECFPFALSVGLPDLRKYEGFDLHRQGLDTDVVALRKVRTEPAPKTRKKKTKIKPTGPTLFDDLQDDGRPDTGPRFSITDIPFATPSSECARLLREGCFHACVSLSLAVVEEIILHAWRVKLRKRKNHRADFCTALHALQTGGFITEELRTKLDQMWVDRHTFLHLRPAMSAERARLEESARTALELLNALVKDFFGYSERENALTPNHPEYWTSTAEPVGAQTERATVFSSS